MPSSVSPIRLIYLEDDRTIARLVQKKLQQAGYQVDLASDGETGLAQLAAVPYDLLLVDYHLPGSDGLSIIQKLAAGGQLPPTIMITGGGDERVAVKALKLGISDYIVKDVAGGYLELLPTVIEQALAHQRLLQEKQQAELALHQHMLALQARNEELDAFAHTVAHDLQSPVTMILAYSELLLEDAEIASTPLQTQVQAITRAGHKMKNMINALLLLAGVRQKEISPEPLNMGEVVSEAQQRLTHVMAQYQAEIILPPAWPVALGYAPWVEEVWANYLSNGLKYGGQPPRLELGAAPQPDGMVRFWVHDNGLGLTPEQQSRLFTQFTQLKQVQTQGHGLGLSIVRRIVEKLGGQVGVESAGLPGQGSTFYFTLPEAP